MNRLMKFCLPMVCVCLAAGFTFAQKQKEVPGADVISRSIKAVGYVVGGGATKVVFIGTTAAPQAKGEAKVDAKKGGTDIDLKVSGMPQPTTLGAEFLTYVLWKTLARWCHAVGLGDEPRKVFTDLQAIRLVDVVLPTRTGLELRKRCVSRPTEHQAILLQRLGLSLPTHLEVGPA